MKILFIVAMIISQSFAGVAVATDNPDRDKARELVTQCKQEALEAGAEDLYDYIYKCLDKLLQYK